MTPQEVSSLEPVTLNCQDFRLQTRLKWCGSRDFQQTSSQESSQGVNDLHPVGELLLSPEPTISANPTHTR